MGETAYRNLPVIAPVSIVMTGSNYEIKLHKLKRFFRCRANGAIVRISST
jgi:hypothetical protein